MNGYDATHPASVFPVNERCITEASSRTPRVVGSPSSQCRPLTRNHRRFWGVRFVVACHPVFLQWRRHDLPQDEPTSRQTLHSAPPHFLGRISTEFYPQITQIAAGLAYLHHHDIVHGDVKGVCITPPLSPSLIHLILLQ